MFTISIITTFNFFEREKQRNRETEKQRNRETEKQRNRETEKQRNNREI
jgi:hypothetical protein